MNKCSILLNGLIVMAILSVYTAIFFAIESITEANHIKSMASLKNVGYSFISYSLFHVAYLLLSGSCDAQDTVLTRNVKKIVLTLLFVCFAIMFSAAVSL